MNVLCMDMVQKKWAHIHTPVTNGHETAGTDNTPNAQLFKPVLVLLKAG